MFVLKSTRNRGLIWWMWRMAKILLNQVFRRPEKAMLQHYEIEEVFMKEKKHGPKKGAAKKWSERLKQIGQQTPPEDLLKILNETVSPTSLVECD